MADDTPVTDDVVQPTGVVLDPSSLQLDVGQDQVVLVSVEPAEADQTVTTVANVELVRVTALGANDDGKLQYRIQALAEGTSDVTFKTAANADISATLSVSTTNATATDEEPMADENTTPSAQESTDSPEPVQAPTAPEASDGTTEGTSNSETTADATQASPGAPAEEAGATSGSSDGGVEAAPAEGEVTTPQDTPAADSDDPEAPQGDGTVNGEEPVPTGDQGPTDPIDTNEDQAEVPPAPKGDGTVNGEKPVYILDGRESRPGTEEGPHNTQGRSYYPEEGGDTNPPVPTRYNPIPKPEAPQGDGSVNGEKPVMYQPEAFEYKPYETDLSVDNPLPPAKPAPAFPH